MKFIDAIINNSPIKEAKLYAPALKAYNAPETGITIQSAAAYNVIKDCAEITLKYLPHYIFGSYANPVSVLKGKVTANDVDEFISNAQNDIVLHQLLVLILDKIEPLITTNSITLEHNTKDPYQENTEVIQKSSAREALIRAFC